MEKVFGLLGHPVGHSMSPLIHNDAFQVLNIEARYHAFDVQPNHVKEAIDGIRALNLSGCNVTVPHKIAVMEFLDEIDDEATQIGAVNTIVNKEGKLIGYNTDGRGYVKSLLEETGEEIGSKKFLIIGAGGAARGIVTALLRQGIGQLTITNRTLEKAQPLLKLAQVYETDACAIEKHKAELTLNEFDVIINTTSIGMSPNIEESPISLKNMKRGTIVSDLIYNPIETKLLKDAKQQGAKTVNGIGMFVNQAVLAFEHWTGENPDPLRMEKIVLQQLGGTTC
ncbi:shikimate dehydrogenase [Halalkalibacter akibai]|uniref:Shikimate dehydrogenase (NADP(+)) n=1 Tax=Halalkalibacter akibai (strain ATCC 43226 / DSM 21942 / CIP 109018 / JCM 9157 / 1139) TaxID=1236973 RepID=W4QNT9_HALA3|nr:shikimate dehydrogenase [Halalkalibacter akibai]GAE33333.1 shikimate 5-dehydrogenase I alpha [Halalkalibacter akibai JCM 9157]